MPNASATTNEPAIAVKGLTVRFGDANVVDGVSFEVPRGAVAAIIGPNGSGKTTLLKAILGLVPSTGETLLFGQSLHAVRGRIGYVPQRFAFDREFPITAYEFMGLGCERCPRSEAEAALHEVGLMPAVLDKRLGDLSGGQLQRVLIAQAIVHKPDLLVLDEPSTGVDIVGEAAFFDVIEHLKETHGTTILMVSHDLTVLSSMVDTVVCLNGKLICAGPPKRVLTPESMNALFGEHTKLYEHLHEAHHHDPHHHEKP